MLWNKIIPCWCCLLYQNHCFKITHCSTSQTEDLTFTLEIPYCISEDSAEYTIVVSNDFGTTTSSATVTVDFVLPNFTEPLKDTPVTMNSDVTLQCRVAGKPEPETRWLISGMAIGASEKYQMVRQQDVVSITITNITMDDTEMTVMCQATNLAGEAITQANLIPKGLFTFLSRLLCVLICMVFLVRIYLEATNHLYRGTAYLLPYRPHFNYL